ncbi:MAG: hypothetical protein NTW86_12900 [Candidatus Sumerlaeota bacterium]|nr:hypothetical protein [Candidatus Sumerlaeota bacterium]
MQTGRRLILLFVAAMLVAWWRVGRAATDADEISRYTAARHAMKLLLERHTFPAADDAVLRETVEALRSAVSYWSREPRSDAPQIPKYRERCQEAVARIATMLDASGQVERVGAGAEVRRRFYPAAAS